MPETEAGVWTEPIDSADPCVGVAGLTRCELVAVVRGRQAAVVAAEAAMAVAVAAVGDGYGMDPDDEWVPEDPREERFRSGPDGMPGFSEFAGAELGPILKVSPGSADWEIRSMLVLRHRHPRLWQAIVAGVVRVWQAKKLIGLTGMAALTLVQARWVDEQLATVVGRVTFGRLLHLTEGLIVAADTAAAEERRLTAARARYVRLVQQGDGLALLEVRGSARDLIVFNAMVDHLADLLAVDGDLSPKTVRRAIAVGILANPAQAVLLLQRHHGDTAGCTGDDVPGAEVPGDDDRAGESGPGDDAADLRGSDAARDDDDGRWPEAEPTDSDGEQGVMPCYPAGRDRDDHRVRRDAVTDDPVAGRHREHWSNLDRPIDPSWLRDIWPEPRPDDADDAGPPDPHPERGPAPPFTDTAKIIITTPPDRLRPRAVLYVHVSAATLQDQDGAVRVEQIGAVTAEQARAWLIGSQVRLQPVLDLGSGGCVDAYELTGPLREQVVVRDGFEVFPFGQQPARGCDLDHATPFRLVGATDPGDVNPLSRTAHRARPTAAGNGSTSARAAPSGPHLPDNATQSTTAEPSTSPERSHFVSRPMRPGSGRRAGTRRRRRVWCRISRCRIRCSCSRPPRSIGFVPRH